MVLPAAETAVHIEKRGKEDIAEDSGTVGVDMCVSASRGEKEREGEREEERGERRERERERLSVSYDRGDRMTSRPMNKDKRPVSLHDSLQP